MMLRSLARFLAMGGMLMSGPLFAGEIGFTRAGADQLSTASLGSGESLAFTYDPSFGHLKNIADQGGSGFDLSFTADALLHLPLSQTVTDVASGESLLSAAITYDAHGLRASRTVSAGSEGKGRSATSYWYGGSLHPLVLERDGVTYRLIGKSVVETLAGSQVTRSYSSADHLGSVRMITDAQGAVTESLGYDGDWGTTRIDGQASAAVDNSVASFYRFQGQEQEVFPLAKLGIDDDALAAWLDQIQLYHFPWRDYGAGLAALTETDPIPTQDSLYAAFGANPVNYADPTGGMIEESKYADEDNENEQAQVQLLLNRFTLNPEISFTRKEHQLLEKAYSKGRDVIVAEIQKHNALHVAVTNLLRNTLYTADAAEDHEEWNVMMMDFYYFEKWHDDVSVRLENAEQRLVEFEKENATFHQALSWSAYSRAFSPDDDESDDDEVANGLLQSMNTAPGPQVPSAEASAVAAREDSPVDNTEAQEDEEKAEYEVKGKGSEPHQPHGQMPE
jgi:hypothetical protein